MIAYAFMIWSYSEHEVEVWYSSKFQEWDWGLIAEDDGAAVAFVAVKDTHLDQLFVDPDYQRRGIGTYLLKAALVEIPAIGTLNVFEQNVFARGFYERHGFREARRFLNEQEQSIELVYARRPSATMAETAALPGRPV